MIEATSGRESGRHGQLAGMLGAFFAAFCCAGLPLVAALLSGLGLSFLRHDWLLFPVELLCFGLVVRGLTKNHRHHGSSSPLLLGCSGLVLQLVGMLAKGTASAVCLVVGASMLLWGVVRDRQALR